MTEYQIDSTGGFSGVVSPNDPQRTQSEMMLTEQTVFSPGVMPTVGHVDEEAKIKMRGLPFPSVPPPALGVAELHSYTCTDHGIIEESGVMAAADINDDDAVFTTMTVYTPNSLPAFSTKVVRGRAPITTSSPRMAPGTPTITVTKSIVNESVPTYSATLTTSPHITSSPNLTSSPHITASPYITTTAPRSTTPVMTSAPVVTSTAYAVEPSVHVPIYGSVDWPAIGVHRNPLAPVGDEDINQVLTQFNFDTSELFKASGGAQQRHIPVSKSMQGRLDPKGVQQRSTRGKKIQEIQEVVEDRRSQLQGELQEVRSQLQDRRSQLQDRVEDNMADLENHLSALEDGLDEIGEEIDVAARGLGEYEDEAFSQQGPQSVHAPSQLLPISERRLEKPKKQMWCC